MKIKHSFYAMVFGVVTGHHASIDLHTWSQTQHRGLLQVPGGGSSVVEKVAIGRSLVWCGNQKNPVLEVKNISPHKSVHLTALLLRLQGASAGVMAGKLN